jgi:hypothetical protein
MFPKTWTKFMDKMVVGQIIIVKGKVDNANPPAKILVDEIDTEIKVTFAVVDEVADNAPPMLPTPLHYKSTVGSVQKASESARERNGESARERVSETASQRGRESAGQRVNVPQAAEVAPAYIPDTDLDGMPPPPDNFPDGWDMEWQPSFEEAAIAAKPEPKFKKNEPVTPPLITRAVTALANIETPEPRDEHLEVATQSMYVPLAKENKDKDHPPRQLTITLRSTGDHERDKRRIKTLHGLLTAQHGRDKFSFQIFENSKGYLIDFPNDTTRICPALLEQLKKLIGEESLRVEEITFQ